MDLMMRHATSVRCTLFIESSGSRIRKNHHPELVPASVPAEKAVQRSAAVMGAAAAHRGLSRGGSARSAPGGEVPPGMGREGGGLEQLLPEVVHGGQRDGTPAPGSAPAPALPSARRAPAQHAQGVSGRGRCDFEELQEELLVPTLV